MARNKEGSYWSRRGEFPIGAILAGLLITVAVAGSAFAYYYLFLRDAAASAGLTITAPEKVFIGQPFDVGVSATNNVEDTLEGVVVSLTLPEGIVFTDSKTERFREETLDRLEPGALETRKFRLVAESEPMSIRRLRAKIRYASSIQPDKEFSGNATADVIVNAVAELNLESPREVLPGEKFNVVIRYRNLSPEQLLNARLRIEAPTFYRLEKASSTPEAGREDMIFNFGDMPGNATGTVTLEGSLLRGPAGSFFNIVAKLTSDVEGATRDLTSQAANIAIAEAPLALSAVINNKENYIARLDDTLEYRLRYKNNSDVAFRDAVVTTALSGTMYDFASLRTDAVFNSLTNTLTWNPSNVRALEVIPPGGEGEVRFSVRVKNSFPIRSVSDKNFSLKADTSIFSPTVPPGVAAKNTLSMALFETKIAGGASFESYAVWSDPGVIVNKGPYPPQANKTTQFTIHWRIRNTATDLVDNHVEATLLAGATFVKVVKSTTESKPVADQNGVVTWDIQRLAATQGLLGAPVETVFQIEVTPGVNRAGDNLPLLSKTLYTAKDDFTGQDLRYDARELDSGARVIP